MKMTKKDILWSSISSLILIGVDVLVCSQLGFGSSKFITALVMTTPFLVPIIWIAWDKKAQARIAGTGRRR